MLRRQKTVVLHVRARHKTSTTSPEEARAVCKFCCPHLNCGFQFLSKHGMQVHAARCEWKNEFEVDFIVSHRGPVVARQYKIRWKGYSSDYDTFEPRDNVHPELIRDYEISNGVYVHGWKHRCDVCDLPCSSARGVAIHKAKAHKKAKQQNFTGSLEDKHVTMCKLVKQQGIRPIIKCCGKPLDNVFRSKYLGTIFTADAQQVHERCQGKDCKSANQVW